MRKLVVIWLQFKLYFDRFTLKKCLFKMPICSAEFWELGAGSFRQLDVLSMNINLTFGGEKTKLSEKRGRC